MSDIHLRSLAREVAVGNLEIGVFDQLCRRHGRVGPALAHACQLLGRLWPVVSRGNEPLQHHRYVTMAYRMGRVEELSDISEITFSYTLNYGQERRDLNDMLEAIYGAAVEVEDGDELDILVVNRYLPPLLALYLFNNNAPGILPHKQVDGIDGIMLEQHTPEEFVGRIHQSARDLFGTRGPISQLEWAIRTVEEGHADVWVDYWHTDQYEEAARLLPPEILEKLVADWNISRFSRFGDFLKKKYKGWFDSAMNAGYESYVYGEVYKECVEAINSFRWESGAVSMIDKELSRESEHSLGVIIIWISIENLQNFLRTQILNGWDGYPFDELLEEIDTENLPHFSENYYGEDPDVIREMLLNDIPEKLEA